MKERLINETSVQRILLKPERMLLIVCRLIVIISLARGMPEDVKSRVGHAIRRRRESLGLTQEDVADRSGLHRTYVGSIERGERNPAVENLVKLSAALGITLAELMALAEL